MIWGIDSINRVSETQVYHCGLAEDLRRHVILTGDDIDRHAAEGIVQIDWAVGMSTERLA